MIIFMYEYDPLFYKTEKVYNCFNFFYIQIWLNVYRKISL